ncbi:cupin domain-containing protein [Halomonas sp. ML-15]|uniref:cupin domain-containing protein n=1 Tax=Halomonas sp. ML-15 TaxID=2773305 RepID=UPI001745D28E|nr:cupin domain-containing protein [Halomonas sp. ML-15]MBD3897289.1 cupin domain-containing protein [Halomonas sp. ML-15]
MYLSKQDIEELEGVRKVHLLNAEAVRINKSLGDAVGMTQLGIHQISVPPGHFSTEYHCHRYEEEAVYVLSGVGMATLGDRKQPIRPGDFIGYPINGVAHEMYNDGDEPLVCLVVGQRLAQDVCDYPRSGKRLYINGSEQTLVDHADIEHIP